MQHKHKDLIIKWANGSTIEYLRQVSGVWAIARTPTWDETVQYRVHIPARTKYEEGNKVLVKRVDSTEYNRVTSLHEWDEKHTYLVTEPDTKWKELFTNGKELEFQYPNCSKWRPVTFKFDWTSNIAIRFREVPKPLVFTEGPIVMTAEGSITRLDVPVTFYNLFKDKARIEIDFTTGKIIFI